MAKKRARFDWSADPDDPALRIPVERPSRSELKQHLEGIADLIHDIVALPARQRSELPLEPEMLAELETLAGTPPSPALKRQLNYVKRLMVDVDVEAVRAAIEGETPRAAMLRRADRWRTRLLAEGNEALGAFLDEYPATDRQSLRAALRRAARPGGERALFDAIVVALGDA